MRILWVTPQLPCLNSGAQVRQYHLLRHLSNDFEIRLVSLVQPSEEKFIPEIESWGVKVYPVPFIPPAQRTGWRNRVESWAQMIFDSKPKFAHTYPLHGLNSMMMTICEDWQPDVCHLETLFVAPLSLSIEKIPWVLSTQNVESENTRTQAKRRNKLTHRIAGYIESQKLLRWEKHWIQRSNCCIAVSDADAEIIKGWDISNDIVIVPNGVDTQWFNAPNTSDNRRRGLLFFGNLGYIPNVDALQYLIQDILPLIQKRHPGIPLNIVGGNASKELTSLFDVPGVDYMGFVPDIRPYLKAAQVCVVPLLSGGGTRLKILEAMAAGLPVVSTTKGAEGLNVKHNENILIANTPREFFEWVDKLMNDEAFARDLSKNAHRLVKNEYDWEGISKYLSQSYSNLKDYS
jgi:polysaccharide biosynthesis protein PslH